MDNTWKIIPLSEAAEICDTLRKPVNSKERTSRISGKSQSELFPYYGATGQVGWIDDYITDGEFVLLGEDGAPFLDAFSEKAYIISGKTWVNNHAHILKSKTSNKFLCYYLNSFNFKGYVSGTTRLKLTQAEMKRIPVPVPPFPEQERIVARIEELFSQLDAGVETLKKTKAQLLRYRRSTIKNELEQSRNDSQWIDTTINQICDCLDSKRKPINKKVREQTKGIYPYYGANGITGRIDDYLFDEELVLVCEDETFIGRVKPFSYIISGKSWVNNHAHILRGKERVVQNKYLNYLLAYYPFVSLVTGTTGRKKLTKSALMNAPVRIIDFESQSRVVEAIESRLSVCDSIEQTVDTALQQAEAMRQSILKKAFEGRL